jgi:type III secretion protein J
VKRAAAAALLAAALLLAGCGQQLYGSLTEHEVNEVVGALRAEGISAGKSRAGDNTWSVSVPAADFARSVAVLRNQNLPAQSFDGLGQVFRKESLVSTETEERARLMYAVSQELQRTLSQIDGVVLARVHPVILPHDAFSSKPRVSSAAVFIKHRPSVDMASKVGMIRELVARGVEDLDEKNVSVALVAAEARAVPSAPEQTHRTVVWTLAVISGVLLVMLALSYLVFAFRDRFREAWVRLRLILADGRGKPPQRAERA